MPLDRRPLKERVITLASYGLGAFFARLPKPDTSAMPRSIVVIKPCCLGDVLMTTPLLAALRQGYPEARITYVVGSWSKAALVNNPTVDAISDCGQTGIPGKYSASDYLRLMERLRVERFDLAVVPDRSPLLTLLPFLAGIPRRAGLDSLGRGFALTDKVQPPALPALRHQVDLYLDIARQLGVTPVNPALAFYPTSADNIHATSLLEIVGADLTQPLVGIFPGGGSNPGMTLTAKRWAAHRFAALADRLALTGAQVLLLGGPGDAPVLEEVMSALHTPAFNLARKTTIGQLGAILARCRLFIGNDSGPLHLAVAVGTPVVALFGPTSPEEYGPYTDKAVVLWKHSGGLPSFTLGVVSGTSAADGLGAITVDEVWAAVAQQLGLTP